MTGPLALLIAHPSSARARPVLVVFAAGLGLALLLAPRSAEACAMRYVPEQVAEVVAPQPDLSLEEAFAMIDGEALVPAPAPPVEQETEEEPPPPPKKAEPRS